MSLQKQSMTQQESVPPPGVGDQHRSVPTCPTLPLGDPSCPGILRAKLESWSMSELRQLAMRLYIPDAEALERHHLIPRLMLLYQGRR